MKLETNLEDCAVAADKRNRILAVVSMPETTMLLAD